MQRGEIMSQRTSKTWKSALLLWPCLTFAPLFVTVARADTPDEQWTFASGLYDQKLWGLAAQNLQKFLAANPKDAHAKLAAYQLAAALYRAGDAKGNVDYTAAAKAYQDALANYPDEKLGVPARFELADAQYNLKQYAPAITNFTQFLSASDTPAKQKASGASDEQRALALYSVGESQLALKKAALAKAAYQQVLQDYPNSAPAPYAQLAIGVLEEDAGQLQNAKAAYDVVAAKYGKSEVAGEARLRAANATLNLGRFDEAATAFQNALNDSNAAQWKAESQIGLADALFGAKKWAAAGAAYNAALQVLAADDERRAGLQMRAGDSAFNAKEYEKAQTSYANLAQNTTPNVAENALYFRGKSLYELGRNDEAAKQFEALLQRFPKSDKAPRAALLLGDVYAQNKDATRAATAYRVVLTQYPQSDAAKDAKAALVDLAAGVVKSGAGDGKSSAELSKVLSSLPPGVAGDAQLRLAQAAYGREDWTQASTLATAALAGKPNDATAENALFLLASSQYNAGKSADAAATFKRQLAAHPKGALAGEAQVRLAWSLLDLKKWDEAETSARAAGTTLDAAKDAALPLKQQARLALAQALWGAGKNAPAATVFGELATSKDADIALQSTYGAAMTLEVQQQWAPSAAQWARYAEMSDAGDKRADAYLHQGLALAKAKNGAQALAAFDRALAADPNGEKGARALLESAWAAHDLKQKEQETQRWQKLAALDSPYAATALLQQGQMAFDAKKWPEAAISYRAVLDKFPNSREAPLAAYQLGSSLYNAEKWAEAAMAFERAAQTPDNTASAEQKDAAVEALFWSGESLRRAGDENAAANSYRKFIASIALRPQIGAAQWLPQARLGLGRALNAKQQWAEAATVLRAALDGGQAAPEVAAEANFLLAQNLAAQNKPQEAATQALKVTTLYPNSAWAAEAAWIAATSIEKGGNKTAALELYRALAKRAGGGEWAVKAKEKLQDSGG